MVKSFTLLAVILFTLLFVGYYAVDVPDEVRAEDTCPVGGEWTKEDWSESWSLRDYSSSNDIVEVCIKGGRRINYYTTDGVDRCWGVDFKAGNKQVTVYESSCSGAGNDEPDISHVSYRIRLSTPTPSPRPTPTDTPTPTRSPSPTPTPTETPGEETPTPTETPTLTPDPSPTPTPTPTESPTPTPTSTSTPPPDDGGGDDSGDDGGDSSSSVGGVSTTAPQVLGLSTTSGASDKNVTFGVIILSIGFGITLSSFIKWTSRKLT